MEMVQRIRWGQDPQVLSRTIIIRLEQGWNRKGFLGRTSLLALWAEHYVIAVYSTKQLQPR